MREDFLHYLWKTMRFQTVGLKTVCGDVISVVSPGQYLQLSGPDFFNAQVVIDGQKWAGNIEIHLKSSDWYLHHHESDPAYENVILHVVWEHDVEIFRRDNSVIPVLELSKYTDAKELNAYQELLVLKSWIYCEKQISSVPPLTFSNWIDRLFFERLEEKTKSIEGYARANHGDWEAVLFWMLAKNFGLNTNGDAFLDVARAVPFHVVRKELVDVENLEALFFGCAGMLEIETDDAYVIGLISRFRFLSAKYGLTAVVGPALQFFKHRPDNFPTIRLAQLAALIHNSSHLFARILETIELGELRDVFNVSANDYWHYHYRFDELSAFRIKNTGKEMCNNILINTVIPVLFAYGCYHKEEKYKMKAIQWLEETEAESNAITRGFTQLKIENRSAFDSQSLIELKTQYCDPRHCLKCSIGNTILNL